MSLIIDKKIKAEGEESLETMIVDGIEIDVVKKKIKNLYIRIAVPSGRVSISAPWRMNRKEILEFAKGKIDWIRSHKRKYEHYQPPEQLSYVSGETIFLWGEKLRLEVMFSKRNEVHLQNGVLQLMVKEDSTTAQKEMVLNRWYRKQLHQESLLYADKWQPILGVNASGWGIKNMKTRWGTCNVKTKKIWISLRLIHKAPRLLEYVIVHELTHLLEKSHSKAFWGYMDQFLLNWKALKKELNGLSLDHNRDPSER